MSQFTTGWISTCLSSRQTEIHTDVFIEVLKLLINDFRDGKTSESKRERISPSKNLKCVTNNLRGHKLCYESTKAQQITSGMCSIFAFYTNTEPLQSDGAYPWDRVQPTFSIRHIKNSSRWKQCPLPLTAFAADRDFGPAILTIRFVYIRPSYMTTAFSSRRTLRPRHHVLNRSVACVSLYLMCPIHKQSNSTGCLQFSFRYGFNRPSSFFNMPTSFKRHYSSALYSVP